MNGKERTNTSDDRKRVPTVLVRVAPPLKRRIEVLAKRNSKTLGQQLEILVEEPLREAEKNSEQQNAV